MMLQKFLNALFAYVLIWFESQYPSSLHAQTLLDLHCKTNFPNIPLFIKYNMMIFHTFII